MRCGRLIVVLLLLTCVLVAGCSESLLTTTMPTEGEPVARSSRTSALPPSALPPTTVTSTADSTNSTAPSPVDAVLGRMTLRQKAAQVLLVSFDGTSMTDLTRGIIVREAPGGFVLLGRNVTGKAQLHLLTTSLQQAAAAAGAPGLFIAADEEGGSVMRVKEGVPNLPSARALAAKSSPAQARVLAKETADGLRSQGVNMVLAPVADVVADRDSFLFSRSYGSETLIVSGFVAAVTQGYEEGGMVTVTKHFPGHGSAPTDSHTSAPVSTASRADFERVHLPPFRAAIAAGVDGAMLGHLLIQAYDRVYPASQSTVIVQELLRGELGFAGLAVTDDLEMAAAVGTEGSVGTGTAAELGGAAVSALAAGCDLLITTGTRDRQVLLGEAIVEAVRSGELPEERLDEAVRRILAMKLEHSIPLPTETAE